MAVFEKQTLSMDIPLITIGIATYNAVKTLGSTLESIFEQTYTNIEVVIADGASTDGTVDLMELYQSKFKGLKYISEADNGIYDAINKTLKMAAGDYYICLGADDKFYEKEVIENFVKLQNDKDNIYYGDVYQATTKYIYDGAFSTFKLTVRNISHQAIFYPRKVYQHYTYDETYKLWSDYHYNIKLWNKHPFKRINLIVVLYGQDGSSSRSVDKKLILDKPGLVKKHFGYVYYLVALLQLLKNKLFKVV